MAFADTVMWVMVILVGLFGLELCVLMAVLTLFSVIRGPEKGYRLWPLLICN